MKFHPNIALVVIDIIANGEEFTTDIEREHAILMLEIGALSGGYSREITGNRAFDGLSVSMKGHAMLAERERLASGTALDFYRF